MKTSHSKIKKEKKVELQVVKETGELVPIKGYQKKFPSQFTNKDVKELIEDYIEWLFADRKNVTFSFFCKEKGIKNPYRLKQYLMDNFNGVDGTINFRELWEEVEYIREEKLIELGVFSKYVNHQFLLGLMKSKFGWHENTVQVNIDLNEVIEAKKRLIEGGKKEKS